MSLHLDHWKAVTKKRLCCCLLTLDKAQIPLLQHLLRRMAIVREITDVLGGPEFWVILQGQAERGVAAGSPINPFG